MMLKMLIHEGGYAAEIAVEEIHDGSPYGPHVRKEDAFKLDRVRLALRKGDLIGASKDAKVFQLMPMAGE